MRLFVGSYGQKDQEEKFLEYITANCSGKFTVRFLRYENNRDWVNSAWRCNYESLKFAIPEICEFKGDAIYIDVSCAVLADLADVPQVFNKDLACQHALGFRTEFLYFKCDKFKNADWPYIMKMKRSGDREEAYVSKMVVSNLNEFGRNPEWLAEENKQGVKIVRGAIPFRIRARS